MCIKGPRLRLFVRLSPNSAFGFQCLNLLLEGRNHSPQLTVVGKAVESVVLPAGTGVNMTIVSLLRSHIKSELNKSDRNSRTWLTYNRTN